MTIVHKPGGAGRPENGPLFLGRPFSFQAWFLHNQGSIQGAVHDSPRPVRELLTARGELPCTYSSRF